MKNKDNISTKLWIGFGIITLISGVVLALDNPFIGIPGSIVGIWLIIANVKKIKE